MVCRGGRTGEDVFQGGGCREGVFPLRVYEGGRSHGFHEGGGLGEYGGVEGR